MIAELVLEMMAIITSDDRIMLVNPQEIVGMRPPKATDHFGPNTQCIIFTTDGKFISAREACDTIREKIK